MKAKARRPLLTKPHVSVHHSDIGRLRKRAENGQKTWQFSSIKLPRLVVRHRRHMYQVFTEAALIGPAVCHYTSSVCRCAVVVHV